MAVEQQSTSEETEPRVIETGGHEHPEKGKPGKGLTVASALRRRLSAPVLLGFLAVSIYLAVWFALSEDGFGVVQPVKLPSPRAVFTAPDKISSVIVDDILATLRRVVIGFVGGTVLGISLGLLMAYNRAVFGFFNPLIEGLRPVPAIAMIPFFLMWFGLAEEGKLLLTVMGVFAIIVVSTLEAVRNVPRVFINAALTLGAKPAVVFRRIVLPRIVPDLVGPLRVALALSFTLVVAAEFMGARSGLGYRLLLHRQLFNTDVLFLGIVMFGVLAAGFDTALRWVLGYLTRWTGRGSSMRGGRV